MTHCVPFWRCFFSLLRYDTIPYTVFSCLSNTVRNDIKCAGPAISGAGLDRDVYHAIEMCDQGLSAEQICEKLGGWTEFPKELSEALIRHRSAVIVFNDGSAEIISAKELTYARIYHRAFKGPPLLGYLTIRGFVEPQGMGEVGRGPSSMNK